MREYIHITVISFIEKVIPVQSKCFFPRKFVQHLSKKWLCLLFHFMVLTRALKYEIMVIYQILQNALVHAYLAFISCRRAWKVATLDR